MLCCESSATPALDWPSLPRVVTHNHLLRTIWGAAHERDFEYLRVAARDLRLKLEEDAGKPRLILNEPAVGIVCGSECAERFQP
ncbi:winged helix-turn-helix domain-containing protein [Sphingomonas sp. LHG3443-2]|uniref:winged helix-turn-helix domain-containing protein n=1 Tax=Sphingomonas sp. LHG3443-2 TaxID=2804639 RepID=UPI003CE80091